MRLFVAVEISDEARNVAVSLAERVKADLGTAMTGRWISPENLHFTVRFIGHVADAAARAMLEALSMPLPLPSFEIVFGSCGVYPRSGPPRVIWIGLNDGLPSLSAMHHEFNRRLLRFGYEPEDRPFSGHLTLARVKHSNATIVRRVVGLSAPAPVGFRVTQATVFQSILSPHGARYRPLVSAPCDG